MINYVFMCLYTVILVSECGGIWYLQISGHCVLFIMLLVLVDTLCDNCLRHVACLILVPTAVPVRGERSHRIRILISDRDSLRKEGQNQTTNIHTLFNRITEYSLIYIFWLLYRHLMIFFLRKNCSFFVCFKCFALC